MQSITRLVYGPSKEGTWASPAYAERVREVQQRLRKEQRSLDREVRQIDQTISKAKTDIKRLARRGDTKNAVVLAREVARSSKHRNRLVTSKAQLNSISLQLQQQLLTGSLQKSTEIMKLSNNLVRLPQMSQSMREMSAELMKAGILEEMMNDTLESSVLGEDENELEEEADAEVDNILSELTGGKLGQAASTSHLPQPAMAEKDTHDLDQMQAQLDNLLRG